MTGARPGYFGGHTTPPARYAPPRAPKKTAPAKVTPKKAVPGSTTGLTPQQWVAQALRAEMAPLEYTEKARQKRAAEAAQQMQYATVGIMKELAAEQAPTAALFDNALAQQKAYATQYAGMLGAANPNAQIQADLKAVGAPEAQQAQVAAQNQANYGGQAASLFQTQGVIPGDTLLANRNAQLGFLAGLPAIEGLAGTRALANANTASQQAHENYIANRMKITAQGPGLIRQVEQDRLAQHNALVGQLQRDTQLAQNARALGDREAYQAAQIKIAQDNAALAQNRYQTQQDQFNVTAGQRDTALTIQQQNANTAAARAAAAADRAAQVEAGKRAKAGKTRQAFFYGQRAKAFARARALAAPPPTGGYGGFFGPSTVPGKTATRQKARNELWNTYWPPLRAAGFKRFAVRKMIDTALVTANPQWKAPAKPKTISPKDRPR